MPIRRAPFRIEAIHAASESDASKAPPTRTCDAQILQKLDAIHELLNITTKSSPIVAPLIAPAAPAVSAQQHQFDSETYEALKTEMNLVRAVIDRTKEEIASINTKGRQFCSPTEVNSELGAVMSGIEDATQQILEAAEAIDQSASALPKVISAEQRATLCQDVSEKVVSIFEACNFQDLAGQRISKVMKAISFIEAHMNVMIGLWGDHNAAAGRPDGHDDDARLLNGPKLPAAIGHASQLEINALFE